MRRVLVVTWALGTATGVLLGLFGVELVSSRFSTAGVSPLSRPEVLRALQAARSVPPGAQQVALAPVTPGTAVPPPSSVDAGPARPSAGPTSSSASAPPASTLPRPGATADTFLEAAAPSSTTSTAPPPEPTTTTTAAPPTDSNTKPKTDDKANDKSIRPSNSSSSTTTATTAKRATTTTTPPTQPSRPAQSPQPQADTKTISSVGGVVAVRYAGGKVELKWARPNPGYQVYVRSNGPDQVIVYFYTRSKISQVVAWYNGTTPAYDVQEQQWGQQNQNGQN